jgi:Flp pilus assembly protein TadD
LDPDWLLPKLWQAQCCDQMRDFAGALELTDTLQTSDPRFRGPGLAQLLLVRVTALRGLGRTNEAALYLDQFVQEQGTHRDVLTAAAMLYAQKGQFQRELELRETLLQRDPNHPELLAKKGQAELRLARFEPAIATLTRALTLAPADSDARLLRAVAYLKAGQLDAARADYRELLKQPGREQSALFGLGGIAWREHDTNAIIRYYQEFLSNSAAMTPQHGIASERLKQVTEE